MSLTSHIEVTAEIDWDDDGDFGDDGEDVSHDVLFPIITRRGRASATDAFSAGQVTFSLRNETGIYTPFNTASPLSPNVRPGRVCQLQVSYDGTTYPVFKGRCSPSGGRFVYDGQVDFEAIDAFEDFRKGKTKTALLENMRVDEIMEQILDDYGWPAGARDLDAALQTVGVFTNAGYIEPTLDALKRAAKQELGGGLFMAKNGDARFQNRNHRSASAALAILASEFNEIVPSMRQEDLVDEVRGAYARFTVAATESIVYTLSAQGRPIYPGVDPRNRFEGTFNGAGVKDAIEPVAVTDYTANGQPDGSGTDRTAQVVVDSFVATSRGFVVQLEGIGGSVAYLYGEPAFQVRGKAITASSEDNVLVATVASPIITGQTLDETFEHNDDSSAVLGWVHFQRCARGGMQPRVELQLTPNSDTLMELVLTAELGDRVRLNHTALPWLTQISGDFFIEAIELEIAGPALVTARWTLLPADLVGGSFFRISGAAMGGQDYSTIVAAAATAGDRIAF